jgi:hypothetical protein
MRIKLLIAANKKSKAKILPMKNCKQSFVNLVDVLKAPEITG